ncbi:MAG: pilus assembly protein TadG-related protein [Woeseiaceae bacterium]
MSQIKRQQALTMKYQSGQTMVFGLVFIVVILIGLIILFNTGQLTRHKMEVQNAADAAAYSAGILTARELNFMAYTNRAMVANQVTIGQFAAFQSWGKKYKLGSTGFTSGFAILTAVLTPIPVIGPGLSTVITRVFQFTLKGYDLLNKIVSQIMMKLGKVANVYIPAMQKLYVFHQKSLTLGTLATQMDMIPKVIDDNAKGAKLSNFGALAVFLSAKEQNLLTSDLTSKAIGETFLRTSDDQKGKRRFAAFVNDSRDGWTKDRRRDLGFDLSSSTNLGFGTLNTEGFVGFKNIRGGTELRFLGSKEKYNWSSLDTVEGQLTFGASFQFVEICLPLVGCFTLPTIMIPELGIPDLSFAGAAAETIEKQSPQRLFKSIPKWKQAPYGGAWRDTPRAANETHVNPAGYQLPNPKFGGIPDFIDINPGKYPGVTSAPTFLISVRKNGDKLRTSDELDIFDNSGSNSDGQFAITTKLSGGKDGFGETVEGDPTNILPNQVNKMVDAFKQNLKASGATSSIGAAAINTLVKQFETMLMEKVDQLQAILQKALPNSADDKGGVFAMAAAEVYFKNPDGSDTVKGSTFSPYWQVRLTAVDNDIRRWSVISQGLLVDEPSSPLSKDEHFNLLKIMSF